MKTLQTIGDELINIMRERRSAEAPPDVVASPPPAPARWTNDHLEFDATGETVLVKIRPPYTGGCQECYQGDGWIVDSETRTARRCDDCRPLRRRAARFARAALPSKFYGKHFDYKAAKADVIAISDAWASSLSDGGYDSLVLTGTPGTGKSFLAYNLARRLLAQRVSVRWVRWQSLLDKIRSTYGGKSAYSEREIWAEVLGSDGVVVVDDFGDGSTTDWAKGQATHMLDCLPPGLRCIITTNATVDGSSGIHLEDVLGIRATSRIFGITGGGRFMLQVSGSDWRRRC